MRPTTSACLKADGETRDVAGDRTANAVDTAGAEILR